MVKKGGNGQNLLGIYWEFQRNMQMRFIGTKCLIRHWEFFPVKILGMLCKIPARFSQCLIRHWEWWESAGNLLGNLTNYANEMFRYKMSDQTLGISPRYSQYKYWECYATFLPRLSISRTCDQTLRIPSQYKYWECYAKFLPYPRMIQKDSSIIQNVLEKSWMIAACLAFLQLILSQFAPLFTLFSALCCRKHHKNKF